MDTIDPVPLCAAADDNHIVPAGASAGPWRHGQQDRRQLLAQAREIKQLAAQLETLQREAEQRTLEKDTLCQQHAAQLAALEVLLREGEATCAMLEARLREGEATCAMLQERLHFIVQSRGYRLMRLYASAFHVPVLGTALWRLRQAAGRLVRMARSTIPHVR